MRNSALAVLTIVVASAGCASSGGGPNTSSTPTQTTATGRVVSGDGSTTQINAMNIDTDVRLFSTGTPDQVWAVLPMVYAELGIPLSMNNSASKTLGNTGWRTRRAIAKVPMQRYLECGSSGTLANAETYSITMSIITSVRSNASGGSVVSTAVTASGRNPVTSNSNEVRCVSTGDLEIRIRDMVQKRVEAM
jgi:hypothetical protein